MTFKDALLVAVKKNKNDVKNVTNIISARSMVKVDGLLLKNLDFNVQDNEKIVCAAIANNPLAFQYASDRLKSSVKFCTIVARINSLSLKYANVSVFNDKKLCHIAINNNSLSYNFLPLHLQESALMVFKACSVKLKEFGRNKNVTTNKAKLWPNNTVDTVLSNFAFLELKIPEKYWSDAVCCYAKDFIKNMRLLVDKEGLEDFLSNYSNSNSNNNKNKLKL